MAIAPCAAKVVSTSMVRVLNGSYQLRCSTITPTTRSPASMGTPTIDRMPPSSTAWCHS